MYCRLSPNSEPIARESAIAVIQINDLDCLLLAIDCPAFLVRRSYPADPSESS